MEKRLTRDQWYDMLAAALGGAARESSFGLVDPKSGYFQEAMAENPKSTKAGEIGSYLIPMPLPGKFKGAGKLGKLLSMLPQQALSRATEKMGDALTKDVKHGIIRGLLSGGASGGANAIANMAIREGLGTGDYGSLEDKGNTAIASTLTSAGGGVLGRLIKEAAKPVYSSRSVVDPTAPKQVRDFVADTLLERGEWGGESHFSDVAKKAKDSYGEILEPMLGKIKDKSGPIEDVTEGYVNKMIDKSKVASSDTPKFWEVYEKAHKSMGPSPKVSSVRDYENILNDELFSLSRKQRMGGSPVPAEMDAFGAMKDSIVNWKKGVLKKEFGEAGDEAFEKANKEYKLGREIERAQDRAGNQPNQSAIGALVADVVKATPVRTGAGVLMNKVNPEKVANVAGRSVEYRRRKDPAYRLKGTGKGEIPNFEELDDEEAELLRMLSEGVE